LPKQSGIPKRNKPMNLSHWNRPASREWIQAGYRLSLFLALLLALASSPTCFEVVLALLLVAILFKIDLIKPEV
jgi:hypothetical protein